MLAVLISGLEVMLLLYADLVPLLESYFRRFGTKLCCFDDMRPYLKALVPNDIRQRLVEIFKETAASLCNDSTDKGRQESVIRGVFIAKVERFLCVIPQSDTDAILAYGNQLWSKYTEALNLGMPEVALVLF